MKRKTATMPLLFTVYLTACVGSLLGVALFGCIFSIVKFLAIIAFTRFIFQNLVTVVTSVVPTFFSCIALLDFLLLLGFTVAFACSVRMRLGYFASAEATTGFALWIPTSL